MGKEQGPPDQKKTGASPQQNHAVPAPQGPKGSVGGKVGCHAESCKAKDVKFNFCDEHFRQFKFGLITKAGQPVLDYEKKFDHYQKWKAAQKVA